MITNHELSEGILQLVLMMVTLIVVMVMITKIMKMVMDDSVEKLESVQCSLPHLNKTDSLLPLCSRGR